MRKHAITTRAAKALAAFLPILFCGHAAAAPRLHCDITYGGATHVLETAVGTDPYRTQSIDIDGRFRFKAIVLGTGGRIDVIKLYAYYVTGRQPVLLQEVKYTPPFAGADSPYALTGLHYLYSPPLGRELQYGCTLRESKP